MKKEINILVTINNRYVSYLLVMLTSLFLNNNHTFRIYCLYSDLSEESKSELKNLIEKYENSVEFLVVDKNIYKDFPVTTALTVECYFILLAHRLLPQNMGRILYLDSDIIVDGSIAELYDMPFDDNYMIVCGQSHKMINGQYYPKDALPEKGECFNSGVLVFNLEKFRREICADTYLEKAKAEDYCFELADQGILNLLFWDKVKYVDTIKYNFRINIYEDYEKDVASDKPVWKKPIIFHYISTDYYKIGCTIKPWHLTLSQSEWERLVDCNLLKEGAYEVPRRNKMAIKMNQKWWYYAKKTNRYPQLLQEMNQKKKQYFRSVFPPNGNPEWEKIKKRKEDFKKITEGKGIQEVNLATYTYGEIEGYIDALSPELAIQTMDNLFTYNCQKLKEKAKKKVGFLVYSSSEWQCEDIYRLLEKDDRFEPVIILCGYQHGNLQTIRRAYTDACACFGERKSEKPYRVLYAGYIEGHKERRIYDEFDILIYIAPYDVLSPKNLNIKERKLNQLNVHIPYAYYLEDSDSLYNRSVFKLSWKYFCPAYIQKEIAASWQRLKAYNVVVSGLPKMDEMIRAVQNKESSIWKCADKDCKKIIWAPHFNMKKGMNGTFHYNYQWFYEYAKNHLDTTWIVRPHPRMAVGVVERGIFPCVEEYYQYLDKWDSLPNARVIPYGAYFDMFATSDAMIVDSLSFLAEYQYTGKPLLLLKPDVPRKLNFLGKALEEILYTTNGKNFKEIEQFINTFSQDEMKEERKCFFEKHLDYMTANGGKTASEFIYNIICEEG